MRVAVRWQDERAIGLIGNRLKGGAGAYVRWPAQRPADRENLFAEKGHIDHRRRADLEERLPALAQRSFQRAATAEREKQPRPTLRRAQKIERGVDPLFDGLSVRVALGAEKHGAEHAPRDRVPLRRHGFGRGIPAIERAVVLLEGKGQERRERHEVEVRSRLRLLFVIERDEDCLQQIIAAVSAKLDDVLPGDFPAEKRRARVFHETRRLGCDIKLGLAQANVVEREQIQKSVGDLTHQRRTQAERRNERPHRIEDSTQVGKRTVQRGFVRVHRLLIAADAIELVLRHIWLRGRVGRFEADVFEQRFASFVVLERVLDPLEELFDFADQSLKCAFSHWSVRPAAAPSPASSLRRRSACRASSRALCKAAASAAC